MSPSSSFVFLSSIFLLLFLAYSPTALTPVHAAAGEVGYFVLIDAGSTGSRAHVHQYVKDPTKKLPVVDESTNKKIKPGLSYYAEKDPPAVRKSIKELLDFIKETVPQKYWAQTPIHVQATAGLRSVTPTEANTVLEIVRDDLETSGFLFQRTWARIISGEQEGINGWMAVNYLLGVFDQSTDSDGQPPQSTGVVEMGGSSMQITFAPSAPTKEDKKQLKEIDIAGHKYFLYTHSFLQYGLQAAEKLYQRLAINDIEDGGNPCYPRAFRHSSVGDFDRCTQLLTKVVDKSVECSSTCSFNGVYQPKIANEPFFAIENFYYTAKFFGTDQEQNQVALPNPEERAPASGNPVTNGLRAKGKEFCNRDWPSLLESYKGKTPTEELSYFCFSAAYQSVVLESGLGFHPRSNLRVAKMINGKGIDWEMGATILELIGSGPSAHDGVEDPASRARLGNTIGSTVDFDTSLALPSSQNRVRSNASQGGICKSCLLYTILFALVVVLAYFTYQRWMKRQSGPMTSYSQAAFNRV